MASFISPRPSDGVKMGVVWNVWQSMTYTFIQHRPLKWYTGVTRATCDTGGSNRPGDMREQTTFLHNLLLFDRNTTQIKQPCVCACVSLFTFGFRAKWFNLAWSKSHLERSTSTSPKKLFLPKVSWCHTERMSVWVLRYSMRTQYCKDNKPGDFVCRLSSAQVATTRRGKVPECV